MTKAQGVVAMSRKWTINDIKQAMMDRGSHWWDASSMRFFRTTVASPVYQGPGGVFFVTRDKSGFGDAPLRWTVRKFDPAELDIDTIGEVAGYRSAAAAQEEAKRLAGESAEVVEDVLNPDDWVSEFVRNVNAHGCKCSASSAYELIELARKHHREQERLCNGNGSEERSENLEAVIVKRSAEIGAKGVHFSGDPRGATVKLILPDGATNDWGSEGWCVPTGNDD